MRVGWVVAREPKAVKGGQGEEARGTRTGCRDQGAIRQVLTGWGKMKDDGKTGRDGGQ